MGFLSIPVVQASTSEKAKVLPPVIHRSRLGSPALALPQPQGHK